MTFANLCSFLLAMFAFAALILKVVELNNRK